MIVCFRSKALKRYWIGGNDSGIRPDWRRKIHLVLACLDAARTAAEMDVPGFGFHGLTGDMSGRFAITVSQNWRITFAMDGENDVEVDLEDYHGG